MALADRVIKELAAFGRKHRNENSCVLTIDAGYVGVGSLEKFAEKCARHSAEWLADQQPLDGAALSEGDLENAQWAMKRRRNPVASVAEWVAEENAERAARLAEGNPYERPGTDEYERLREPKEMTYPYGELISLRMDRSYLSHYDDDSRQGSPYARAVDALLAELERRRAEIQTAIPITRDFRVVRVDHEY